MLTAEWKKINLHTLYNKKNQNHKIVVFILTENEIENKKELQRERDRKKKQ